MLKSGAWGFAGLTTLVVLAYATAATADPIVITGVSISMVNGIDLPGFTLTAPDSSMAQFYSAALSDSFSLPGTRTGSEFMHRSRCWPPISNVR